MSVRIRLAREVDSGVIAQMSRRYIEHGLPWTWTESRIRYYVRNQECAVIVARTARALGGFAIMEFHDTHAHLNLLAVHPGCRRRGLGRALVEWLEASARTAGIFLVRLEMRAGNAEARSFYERLGYSATGTSPAYYAGREDALRMQRNLSLISTLQDRSSD